MNRIYYFLAGERLQVGELVIVNNEEGIRKVTASDVYKAIFYVLQGRNQTVYELGDVVPVAPLINGEVYRTG